MLTCDSFSFNVSRSSKSADTRCKVDAGVGRLSSGARLRVYAEDAAGNLSARTPQSLNRERSRKGTLLGSLKGGCLS